MAKKMRLAQNGYSDSLKLYQKGKALLEDYWQRSYTDKEYQDYVRNAGNFWSTPIKQVIQQKGLDKDPIKPVSFTTKANLPVYKKPTKPKKTAIQPIYTTDPNDPAYKSYQDSLRLYSGSKAQFDKQQQEDYKHYIDIYNRLMKSTALSDKEKAELSKPNFNDWYKYNEHYDTEDLGKMLKSKLKIGKDYAGNTWANILDGQYPTGLSDQTAIRNWNNPIKPIGYHYGEGGVHNMVYKKPVRSVILQRQKFPEAELTDIPNESQVSLPPATLDRVPSMQVQSSKTPWYFQYADQGKQKLQYFPTEQAYEEALKDIRENDAGNFYHSSEERGQKSATIHNKYKPSMKQYGGKIQYCKQCGGKADILQNAGSRKLNVKTSIVDFLKSIGIDSSFENRRKMYTELTGKQYKRTDNADQNIALMKAVLAMINRPAEEAPGPSAYSTIGMDANQPPSAYSSFGTEGSSLPPPSAYDSFYGNAEPQTPSAYESFYDNGTSQSSSAYAADDNRIYEAPNQLPPVTIKAIRRGIPGYMTAPNMPARAGNYPFSGREMDYIKQLTGQAPFTGKIPIRGHGGKIKLCQNCGSMSSLPVFINAGHAPLMQGAGFSGTAEDLRRRRSEQDYFEARPPQLGPDFWDNRVPLDQASQQARSNEDIPGNYTDYLKREQFTDQFYQSPETSDQAKEAFKNAETPKVPWTDYLHAGEDTIQYIGGLFNEARNYRNEMKQRRRGLENQAEDIYDKDRYGLNPASFLMEYGGEIPEMIPLMRKGGKNWIKKAVNPKHKGYCTPMTKKTCTPRRKALARTFKKHHGFHKKAAQYGGLVDEILMRSGGPTASKAKEMLRDGTVHGKPLTAKQKKYFGYLAGGGRSDYYTPSVQNAGSATDVVPEIDGAPDMNPEVWAESGEVVRMRDGSISKIAANGKRTFDHGEKKGIPGTPINGAESFLEATSTKKGRTAMADQLLKVDPDTAERITGGYRPKVPLSHATLYDQSMTHYGKLSEKMNKRMKLQLDRGINNEANRNSIKHNLDFIRGIPSGNDLYESIYGHQEMVKQVTGIPDEPTAEQISQYDVKPPVMAQVGGRGRWAAPGATGRIIPGGRTRQRPPIRIASPGTGTTVPPVSGGRTGHDLRVKEWKQTHLDPGDPRQFRSFEDMHRYYTDTWGYQGPLYRADGEKAIKELQQWMVDTPEIQGNLLMYLRNVPLTGKGYEKYSTKYGDNTDEGKLTNEELLDAFVDDRWDFRSPYIDKINMPQPVKKPGMDLDLDIGEEERGKIPYQKNKPPYFPLEYSDIASARGAYLDAMNRDQETLLNTYMPRVQYKTLDPTRAVREVDYNANAALMNLPGGTQGMGMRAQVQANADKQKFSIGSQYDNQNIGILNREEDVNAEWKAKENMARTQNVQTFLDHVLQSRAVAGDQKKQARDSYYSTINKNRMFNRMVQMLDQPHYTINADGSIGFDGSWNVNSSTSGANTGSAASTGKKHALQYKNTPNGPVVFDPNTGQSHPIEGLPGNTSRRGRHNYGNGVYR